VTNYTVALGSAFTLSATRAMVGALDGGYFVTIDTGSPYDLYLHNVSAPTVAVDTAVGSYDNFDGYVIANDAGDLYIMDYVSSTTRRLNRVTQSGGVLSVTNMGTATVPLGGFAAPLHLTHDGSQIVGRPLGGDGAMAISTSNASAAYTSAGAGHNLRLLSAPAADRYLAYCLDDYQFELWDGPGNALLDSLTGESDLDWEDGFYPTGANRIFGAWSNSTLAAAERRIGVIDATGDALSWAWGPSTVTTDWVGDPLQAYSACWGSIAAFMPGDTGTTDGSLYVVDTLTGAVSSSSISTYMDGVDSSRAIGFAGAGNVVAFHFNGTDGWTTWTVTPLPATTTPAYLRQRQSPKRTPSRVSYRVA
jgi:hypothetical protein